MAAPKDAKDNVTLADAAAVAESRAESDAKADVGSHAGPEQFDAPPEQVVTLALSGPSATSPIKGEELFGAFDQNLEKREQFSAPEMPKPLPRSVVESKDLRHLNPSARENLYSVVLRPGHVFSAPGRYHDVTNVENKYDVMPNDILPSGKYVVSERYLLSAFERGLNVGA